MTNKFFCHFDALRKIDTIYIVGSILTHGDIIFIAKQRLWVHFLWDATTSYILFSSLHILYDWDYYYYNTISKNTNNIMVVSTYGTI